ncbi:MAG: hydrogenase formation protein HypD [Ignavibacteria bacterium]|nr:hydrogenase formation protein HypD [Ignavibacteria bacterium]
MKYLSEFRNPELVKHLSNKIKAITVGNWRIMEICGGQTHSIMKYNLEEFIPEKIKLLHGPGCPVCVTPAVKIDYAINIAKQKNTIIATYGDMLRVPGSEKDLLSAKAEGCDIRMVYSPLEAVSIAEENPNKKIVFFAIGFETTASPNALAIKYAKQKNLNNFVVLSSMFRVPPAIEFLLSDYQNKINGFLAAGHVCTVMGYEEYIPISENYKVPIVITGFEPTDILSGIYQVVLQLERGDYQVINEYKRVVRREGNIASIDTIKEVFQTVDMEWRGVGVIPNSGFDLNEKYKEYSFDFHFSDTKAQVDLKRKQENTICIAGEIMQGKKTPLDCKAFGSLCTPETPLGAPMVSSEGTCSAYLKYNKDKVS